MQRDSALTFNFSFIVDSYEITRKNSHHGWRKLGYRNRQDYLGPG